MDALAQPEMEAELLGQLMFDNQLVEPVADFLEPSAFSEPTHARIYSAVLAEVQRGNLANAVTLKPYFDGDEGMKALGGTIYLAQIQGNAGFTNATEVGRQIARLGQRRSMRDGLSHAAGLCNDLAVELPAILDEADTALSQQSKSSIAQPTGAECIGELIQSIGSKQRGVISGQIPSLDGLLGPLRPKQLTVLAARPGMGKTALALSYGLGAAQKGHGVLFVSLEMSGIELATRMVADLCYDQDVDMPYTAVRDGALNASQREWLANAHAFASELPFQVIDTGSLTVSRLSMLVRSHKRRMAANGQRLDLVIVDYLQLLQGDRRASAYERISEVSMGLKALAKDAGVAIMALAQLSRAVEQREDKRPQLSDLRDSGQIEQDADAVLFLLREEYYLRQAEPDQFDDKRGDWQVAMADAKDKIEFILAKRRNGVTGKATGHFYSAYQAVRG